MIQRLLERDLRGFGVFAADKDSATLIRVTLSENLQGGLWVAEVVEGTETRVTMVRVNLDGAKSACRTRESGGSTDSDDHRAGAGAGCPDLHRRYPGAPGGAETGPDRDLGEEQCRACLCQHWTRRGLGRGSALCGYTHQAVSARYAWRTRPITRFVCFDAWLPGVQCAGTNTGAQIAVTCAESDDPWPVLGPIGSHVAGSVGGPAGVPQRAFYNAMRNFFTGVLAPGYGMDFPPFYEASDIPRPTGTGLLLNTVDGRLLLIENNTLKPVAGAADWGSDFAVLRSECGSGVQVLVSGSGSASAGDSLRAWEIVGREAVPASPPLPVEGAVMAVHAENNGIGATVVVRRDAPLRYEVWNGSALCH